MLRRNNKPNADLINGEIDLYLQNDPVAAEDIDAAMALTLVDAWVRAQLPNTANLRVETWWSENFSAHIRSIGRVLGKQFIFIDPHSNARIILASYRIDWDPGKGKHFNISISSLHLRKKSDREKYVFKFGNLLNDQVIDAKKNKPVGELAIMRYTLQLTRTALNDQVEIPVLLAVKLERMIDICERTTPGHNREIDDLKLYFAEMGPVFAENLKPAVHEAIVRENARLDAEEQERKATVEREHQLKKEKQQQLIEEQEHKKKITHRTTSKKQKRLATPTKRHLITPHQSQSFFYRAVDIMLSYINCYGRSKKNQVTSEDNDILSVKAQKKIEKK